MQGDRAVSYARFSTDMQNPRSVPDQHHDNRAYCAGKGYHFIDEFSDPATTGAFPAHLRPGLQDLVRRAEAREFDVVVVEALDRLARSLSITASLHEELQHYGIRIETLKERRELTDLEVAIQGYMNADYRRTTAQKVRRGHSGRVREGKAPAGRPPYGYRAIKSEAYGRVIDQAQAAVVRRIAEHYVAGVSPTRICQALNGEGIPSPGGGLWTRAALLGARTRQSGILGNPIYIGETIYGRRSQPKNPKTGRVESRATPEDQWARGHNPELAILDLEVWEAVQRRRAAGARPHPRYNRRPKTLLAGLAVCDLCAAPMYVARRTRDGRSRYMMCSTHVKCGGCANGRLVRADDLEQRVLDGLRRALLSPEAVELAVTTYREARARLAVERARMRDSTERELIEVRRQIGNVRRSLRDGYSRALTQDLADLERREQALEARLPSTEPDIVALHPQAATSYAKIVEDLGKTLSGPEPARARAMGLLRSLITSVRVIPTAPRTPVGLKITGNILGLITAGSGRQDAASQAVSIAIPA
jgi:DNA invertase Pin-like site-specific DNA recombinase